MVRSLAIMLLCTGLSLAQESFQERRLLASSMTISPSKMLNRDQSNIYLSGFLEWHFDANVSFRGDTYLFIDSNADDPFVYQAFRNYFGVQYNHWTGNWVNSIGFQPGVTVMESNLVDENGLSHGSKLSPSMALRVGTSYYFWKYFHFFANVSYTKSKLTGIPRSPHGTDEIFFSAGLGFQIPTKKN